MPTDIPSELTRANLDRVLEILAGTHPQLEALSRGLKPAQLCRPLGKGERSMTEDLAHLLHSEARHSEAIFLALLDREPLFNNVHSERQFGQLVRFDLLPFAELLPYFRLRRQVLLRVLEPLSLIQWSRCVREPGKQRKESVYWRARALAAHEQEHCGDMEAKLARLRLKP